MMLRENEFDSVVLGLLEAAAVPELWPDALHGLARACGASGAISHLVVPGQPTRSFWSVAVAEHAESYYASGWDRGNSRMERSMALVLQGWRGIITEHDTFTPEELASDPFHQEWSYPRGYTSYAGSVVASAPGMFLPISLERWKREQPFSRNEVATMNRLFDNLHTAANLAMQISVASAGRVTDALGALGQPAALVGRDGRVVTLNAPFDGLMGDGLRLVDGRLTALHKASDQMLASVIHRAVGFTGPDNHPLQPVVVPRCNGRRPLLVQLTPLIGAAADMFQCASAILFLTDLEDRPKRPPAAVLREAFGLTAAEARLASHLAEGLTLEEAAHADDLSRETMRSRLKAIFSKTGTNRQAELLLLLSKVCPETRHQSQSEHCAA